MVRVIIAEDHDILREGLQSLLRDEPKIKVVAGAANGKILLDYLETTPVDVILMDINMPVMNGVEATKIIASEFPKIKVLVLSMMDNPNYLTMMMEAGAKGYILKSTGKEELVHAIEVVAAGGKYISPSLQAKAEALNAKTNNDSFDDVKLTRRELQILEMLAEGMTNKEIAEKIFLSRRTVETHRKNLIEKTNCKNSSALIKYAIEKGYLKNLNIEKFSD
ncbi:MAG: DNA-binding response regulator [Bacteroidetes bacterium]|jgi:DNA-binding NarL/FixJ family response regulator|nr:DNA-binding response regulator [Bacteroidota bacterium]